MRRVKERLKTFKEKLKTQFKDLSRENTSIHSIALGLAIGTFIAITPTLGLDLLVGLLVVLIYKNLNKLAVFLGLLIWNPITMIPIHLSSLKIGNFFLGSVPLVKFDIHILNEIYNFSIRYLIGNLILAVVISLLSYFIALVVVRWYRRKG